MADYAHMWANQRVLARQRYGSFQVTGTTSESTFPRLSGTYALDMLKYWDAEVQKVADHYVRQGNIAGLPAGYKDWMFKLAALQKYKALMAPAMMSAGNTWVANDVAHQVWNLTSGVMLPMRGISETPTPWKYGMASIAEASAELAKFVKDIPKNVWNAIFPPWLFPVMLGVGAIYVYNNFLRKRD
jgi:hypothetical protein